MIKKKNINFGNGLLIFHQDEYGRISQERLAELCNVSGSLIANIESLKVKQTFSITVIATISKVLNIPFECFFQEKKL